MQVLVTHEGSQRTRVFRVNRAKLALGLAAFVLLVMAMSGAVYHFVFLTAAREGWPVVSQLVKLIVRDEIAQRDRVMRDNLDAMAQRVGEMHAKLVRLEAMGDRVSGLVGVKVEDIRPLPTPPANAASAAPAPARGGKGGPYVPASPTLAEMDGWLSALDASADQHTDLYTLFEARLLEARLKAMMVPTSAPVIGPIGSGFGFRADPISGRAALHTGLDFPADPGTPILAAAGGVVIVAETHPAYGHMIEIDHGNGLVTRYAHCSALHVAQGALVKRGQKIAEVGNSGRSTGPHLHFEVLLGDRPQDPARFLALVPGATMEFARRPGR
ncbi:MAG: M23 family metallopeptidase [Rubrivivax sp.]|nr:M23 family metallopeptidase [Rubrivivax sp.]